MDKETSKELQPINVNTRGCMDGRKIALRFIKHRDGSITLLSNLETSRDVVEAKLPGADLGFVALLQNPTVMGNHATLSNLDAVQTTTRILKGMGLTPQFHVDDDHGHLSIPTSPDHSWMRSLTDQHKSGCGFAGLTWGEQANAIIQLAVDQEWACEVLTGPHSEVTADQISNKGQGINTDAAKGSRFGFNLPEISAILQKMESDLSIPGFTERAIASLSATFEMVAKKISSGAIANVRKI